ncbi:MAG: mechanosensitive ion channel family protein [Planctomycetota bacterium]
MPHANRYRLLFALAVLAASSIVHRAAAQPAAVMAPADTRSPRATLESFLNACNEAYALVKADGYYRRVRPEHRQAAKRVLDCINTEGLPEYARWEVAAEAAICIKELLDRADLPPLSEAPGEEQVEADPDRFARWRIPGTRLIIARVTSGPQTHEYLFTPGSVQRALEDYQDAAAVPYRTTGFATTPGFYQWYLTAPSQRWVGTLLDGGPAWLRDRALGLSIWKWIALALVTLAALLALAGLAWLHRRFAAPLRDRRPVLYLLSIVVPIAALLVVRCYGWSIERVVTLRGDWLYAVSFASNLVGLLAIVLIVFALVDRLTVLIIAAPSINPSGLDAQVIRILARLTSLSVAVIVFLEGGGYLGIPVTTLLASAGVGGVAVALASQDMLKNLFGTIMLMADKPFRAGERIIVEGYDGVVEEIGLRSTRLRLLTGHLVTIPNETLARSDIENVARRPSIRRVADLRLPLDTPREKVHQAAEVVRGLLADHEGMAADLPPRVFFNEFNTDSFNLRVIYWYHPPDYWAFLDFTERLNLQLMQRFEELGVRWTQTVRVTGGPPESVASAKAAEASD